MLTNFNEVCTVSDFMTVSMVVLEFTHPGRWLDGNVVKLIHVFSYFHCECTVKNKYNYLLFFETFVVYSNI